MEYIKNIIHERNELYKKSPFIRFLENEEIPAEERLSFLPYGVYFFMMFADMNRFMLPVPGSDDPIQQMINTHAEEDSKHWAWFLQDLQIMGANTNTPFVDTIKFIWSKENVNTRLFCHKLTQLCMNADPLDKLVIIECIETTGNVALNAIVNASKSVSYGEKLVFSGQHHLDHELGHAMGSEEDEINNIHYPEERRNHARQIIKEVYMGMENFNRDLMDRVLKHSENISSETKERVSQYENV